MTKKLYIDNPYLKETYATIIDKRFKDGKSFIKLDRTIFFPHIPGVQPRDLGTIDHKRVIDVYKDNSEIVHVVEKEIKTNKVLLSIDWKYRFDLMQNHTGMHILSAAFKQLFNVETIDFHMDENIMTIDVESLDLSKDVIFQIETLANKIVQSNFKVISKLLDYNKIKQLDLFNIAKNNEKTNKRIRIVNIDNINLSICSGTHVSNTGEVGLIKILNSKTYKDNCRVSFICGNRALEDYHIKNELLNKISKSLLSKETDILENLFKLKRSKEDIETEKNLLKEELISLKAEMLLEKRQTFNNIDYVIQDLGSMDMQELHLISSYLIEKENLIQIYKLKNENQGCFLVSKSYNLDIDLREIFNLVSEKIIVKGEVDEKNIQGTTSHTIIDRVIELFFKEIQMYFKG